MRAAASTELAKQAEGGIPCPAPARSPTRSAPPLHTVTLHIHTPQTVRQDHGGLFHATSDRGTHAPLAWLPRWRSTTRDWRWSVKNTFQGTRRQHADAAPTALIARPCSRQCVQPCLLPDLLPAILLTQRSHGQQQWSPSGHRNTAQKHKRSHKQSDGQPCARKAVW